MMMLAINSEIEGKRTNFGIARHAFDSFGCSFCSNFEYEQGKFDAVLWREEGETIYLRVPFKVLEGELDHASAYIQFGTPYLIKHHVNIGLDHGEGSFITATTGLNQFQEPLDKDAKIRDESRWVQAGESLIQRIMGSLQQELSS